MTRDSVAEAVGKLLGILRSDGHFNTAIFDEGPVAAFDAVDDRAAIFNVLLASGDSNVFHALAEPPTYTVKALGNVILPNEGYEAFDKLTKPDPPTHGSEEGPKSKVQAGVHLSFVSHFLIGLEQGTGSDDWIISLGVQNLVRAFPSSQTPTPDTECIFAAEGGATDLYDQSTIELALELLMPIGVWSSNTYESIESSTYATSAKGQVQFAASLRRSGLTTPLKDSGEISGLRLTGLAGRSSPLLVQITEDGATWKDADLTKEGPWHEALVALIAGGADNNKVEADEYPYFESLASAPLCPIRAVNNGAFWPTKSARKETWEEAKKAWGVVRGFATKGPSSIGDHVQNKPHEKTTKHGGLAAKAIDGQASQRLDAVQLLRFFNVLTWQGNAEQGDWHFESLEKLKDADLPDFGHTLAILAKALDGFALVTTELALGKTPDAVEADEESDTQSEPDDHVEMPKSLVSLMLALTEDVDDPSTLYFGLRGQVQNIPVPRQLSLDAERAWLIQLGNWFSGGTSEDNWFWRSMPKDKRTPSGPPGIGIYPMALTPQGKGGMSVKSAFRMDLISVGLDIIGMQKQGVSKILPEMTGGRLTIGAIETRFIVGAENTGGPVTVGMGVKLDGIKPRFKKSDAESEATMDPSAETTDGLTGVLSGGDSAPEDDGPDQFYTNALRTLQEMVKADSDTVAAAQKKIDADPVLKAKQQARIAKAKAARKLEAAWQEGFGFSFSFLGAGDAKGTDFQLYNGEGERAGDIWIPVNAGKKNLTLKAIGFALQGVEAGHPKLSLKVTGELAFRVLKLGLIGAGYTFNLKPKEFIMATDDSPTTAGGKAREVLMNRFNLDGLVFELDKADVDVSGGLLRHTMADGGWELIGDLRVITPAVSLAAMAAVGKMKNGVWSFFGYGFLGGQNEGIDVLGILQIKGVALGLGINRQVKVPAIDAVHEFPLVTLVMGEGGADHEEEADPLAMMQRMANSIIPAEHDFFFAGGLTFSFLELLDCFALLIVQYAGKDSELALLGVARTRVPKEGTAMAYLELDMKADYKPVKGILLCKMEVVHSWVLDRNCQLTGDFALKAWMLGEHKGDVVVTLGGYDPRFLAPANYPTANRLGFDWLVNSHLSFSGGFYFAVTPAAMMAGGHLSAQFHAGPLTAWFKFQAHLLMQYKPFYYDAEASVTLHAELHVAVKLHLTISLSVDLTGPPLHAHIQFKIGPFHKHIDLGAKASKPPTIKHWPEFGRSFIDRQNELGEPADGGDSSYSGKWSTPGLSAAAQLAQDPSTATLQVLYPSLYNTLLAGLHPTDAILAGPHVLTLDLITGAHAHPSAKKSTKPRPWAVRADELSFRVSSAIPVETLQVIETTDGTTIKSVALGDPTGQGSTGSAHFMGQNLSLATVAKLSPTVAPDSQTWPTIMVRPMGSSTSLGSSLLITIHKLNAGTGDWEAIDPSLWTLDHQTGAAPQAHWGASDDYDPDLPPGKDKLSIPGALFGVQNLKPPVGGLRGLSLPEFSAADLRWDELAGAESPVTSDLTPEAAPTTGTYTAATFESDYFAGGSEQTLRDTAVSALAELGFGQVSPDGDLETTGADVTPFTAGSSFRALLADPLSR